MKSILLAVISAVVALQGFAQRVSHDSTVQLLGSIEDKITHEPLAYATIGVTGQVHQAYSQSSGGFILRIPRAALNDTLVVTYLGYRTHKQLISTLSSSSPILLEPTAIILPDVSISNHKFDLRYIDRNLRVIREPLYGMDCEVTNDEYNYFINDLKDSHRDQLLAVADFNLSAYEKSAAAFYNRYHHSPAAPRKKRKDSLAGFGDYPAVNISHAAAMAYCDWLTEKYNENPGRKKFKKVKFRLPTLKEWQIAALGYPKFQSWEFLENTVEVIVPADTLTTPIDKGTRKMISARDKVLYPWYKAYYLRDHPQNYKACYLGNFFIAYAPERHCPAQVAGFDGFIIMGRVGQYFPNNMGFYDVVGNVAEMIDEPGIALGGSWKDVPAQSTMLSSKKYSGPDESVGFRVFMDVVEK